jgi:hypothetical protein
LNKETSAQADEPEAVLGQIDAHQAIAHQPDTARTAH